MLLKFAVLIRPELNSLFPEAISIKADWIEVQFSLTKMIISKAGACQPAGKTLKVLQDGHLTRFLESVVGLKNDRAQQKRLSFQHIGGELGALAGVHKLPGALENRAKERKKRFSGIS